MANGIVLSILIPTIKGREAQFQKLHNTLSEQLYSKGIWNEIEIVSECDDRTMSIGNKRQLLLSRSYGDYVVFIDDDDKVADDYCLTIWNAIKNHPSADSIGFLQECIFDGGAPKKASLSNKWYGWAEKTGGFDYVRTPFFPTPIRRDIAVSIGYKDMRFGEDYDFSVRLKESGLIVNEVFIEKVMYYYQYTHAPHQIKYGKPI
jgi:hypothetical protein